MTTKSELINYVNELLEIESFSDNSWNGLQVDNSRSEVAKLAFAVDAGTQSIAKAAEAKADMLFVHHGIFWDGANPSLQKHTYKRVQGLLRHDLALYAAHLPLDAHPQLGNNAKLAEMVGAETYATFSGRRDRGIGVMARFATPKPFRDILAELNTKLSTDCRFLDFGTVDVKTVAILSGGPGSADAYEAIARGADLYITGEARDHYNLAYDAEINMIFAGHYKSETLGIKALAKEIEQQFDLKTVFIDTPTQL